MAVVTAPRGVVGTDRRTDAPARAALRWRRLLPDGLWPYLFVAPAGLGITVFYLWPIVQTFYYSFTEWGVFGDSRWIGTENYVRLVSDPDFYSSLVNTLVYSVITCLSIPVAVVLAAMLNLKGLRLAGIFRVLYFLPYIAMPVAIAMVWRVIFNGEYGIVNWVLGWFGIDGPRWLSTPGYTIVAISVVGFWSTIGFAIIVFAAGLRAIPKEYEEAASLDGAGPVRHFIHITVPLLTPTIFFVLVVTLIGSLQLFDLVYAMLGKANPALPDSMSLVYYFYKVGFVQHNQGYAAALAMVILVLIGLITYVQFRLQRRWVHYGDD